MKKEEMISFRVDSDIHALVTEVSEGRNESISDFVRKLVLTELARLSFLPERQKKALGVAIVGVPAQ